MVKKLPYKKFKEIYAQVPRLSVDLFIKTNQGVLLTLRKIEPIGVWHMPGGTVLYDETIEDTIQRIAHDELGVDVKIGDVLGVVDFYNSPDVYGHAISIVYKVELTSNNITLNHQASDFNFFPKLPENTLDVHKRFLQDKI